MISATSCLQFVLIIIALFAHVSGHGKMIDPPGRNTVMNTQRKLGIFKKNCATGDINYSDKSNFCGGRNVQKANKGKCGACGDNFADKYPRKHDLGGKYVKSKTPVRAYREGQIITVKVEITASHKGSFEFRLCNKLESSFPNTDVLTDCYSDPSKHMVLQTTDGKTRYTGAGNQVSIDKTGIYSIDLQLPVGVTCPNGCNLQWWYETGNNPPPTFQEHFVNCADILIMNCAQYQALFSKTEWCAYGPTDELTNCKDEPKVPFNPTAVDNPTAVKPNVPTVVPNVPYNPTAVKPNVPTVDTKQNCTCPPVIVPTCPVIVPTCPVIVPQTCPPLPPASNEEYEGDWSNENDGIEPAINVPDMTCTECTLAKVDTCNNRCCKSKTQYTKVSGMSVSNQWCKLNCPKYCPPAFCTVMTTWVPSPRCARNLNDFLKRLIDAQTDETEDEDN